MTYAFHNTSVLRSQSPDMTHVYLFAPIDPVNDLGDLTVYPQNDFFKSLFILARSLPHR
jgi:hypothetical protein